jgi:LTXXQ motif family protein
MTSFVAMSVATLLVLAGPSMAQQATKDVGWGARVMMEPIILAYGGFAALCNPRAAARAQWGVEQIEKAVKPTEAQRAAFNELKAAAAKATSLTPGACPQGIPRTSRERLSFTARRIEAILEAIKTVAPAFATFYDSLGDEQKAQIDAGPRRWRWAR